MTVTPALNTAQQHAARLAAKAAPSKKQRLIEETALVRQLMSEEDQIEDIAVQDMTWVGYRHMSPLARTELFHAAYLRKYRQFHAEKHPDKDPAKLRPLPDELTACEIGVVKSLWKARLCADVAGVPYDFYLDQVMRSRMHVDHWQRPPRPNQLYPNHVLTMVGHAWGKTDKQPYLYTDEWDDRFFAEANIDGPLQQEARLLLVEVVNKSSDPAAVLADFMCIEQAITSELARELFGDELVEAALQLVTEKPVTGGVPKKSEPIPNCIGYFAPDETNGKCEFCPVASQCKQIDQAIRARLEAETGAEDPWAARVRADARERQRRSRAKYVTTPAERAMRRQAENDRIKRDARKELERELLARGRSISANKRARAAGAELEIKTDHQS